MTIGPLLPDASVPRKSQGLRDKVTLRLPRGSTYSAHWSRPRALGEIADGTTIATTATPSEYSGPKSFV